MQRIKFWNNFSPLQRRAIVLVGVSFFVGFFLSRRELSSSAVRFPTTWQEYGRSSSPAFRVQFPEYPRHVVQDVTLSSLAITVKKGVFVSEDSDGRQYVLAVAEYPQHTPSFATEKIVEAELQSLFQNTSDYTIDMNLNAIGADFSATRFDGGPSVKGKIVVNGQEVYMLSFSALPSPASDERYQQFIISFKHD